MAKKNETVFRIGDGQGWSFLNGNWNDGPERELIPPDGIKIEYLAVKEDEVYADFSARFRFKFRAPTGGARFLFRVQDSRRFYALDVPWCGQQNRSRHFWAGVVIADGTPLQRYLNFNLVPGLCASVERWYEARVEATGTRLRAWIEDIPVADVEDTTYQSGRLGLGAIVTPHRETAHFADVVVAGAPVNGSAWSGLETPPPHWITPCPEVDPKTYQSYASLLKSKSGEITICLNIGNPNIGEVRRTLFLRSGDGGRTWAKPEPGTLQQGLGGNFVREDGTWVCVFGHPKIYAVKAPLYSYESDDQGRTWNTPRALNVQGEWPEGWDVQGPFRAVRMHDGALVLPVMVKLEEPAAKTLVVFITCFAIRSEDDGHTWSAPVLCDSHNMEPGKPLLSDDRALGLAGRYYELGMAEVRDNVLIGIGRPERDPYMWQIQSNNGGRTWEPAALGHFPGYCPSLTRTTGGALVATTRFPYFAARLSRNGGRTWEPPVIVDYSQWANQQAVEVEPDVVLVNYMGHIMEPGEADSRIARLRVTDDGLCLDH
jgi:hypothetical protein